MKYSSYFNSPIQETSTRRVRVHIKMISLVSLLFPILGCFWTCIDESGGLGEGAWGGGAIEKNLSESEVGSKQV
jgi:hypothetical protein